MSSQAPGLTKVDKSRWAAREYATEKSDDVFAPAPTGVADNLIEFVAVKTGNPMVIGDVSSAFCHAPEPEDVYMWPPQEDLDRMKKRYPNGFVWRMLRQLYGRRRAGQSWQGHLAEIMAKLGFRRGVIDPTVFVHEQLELLLRGMWMTLRPQDRRRH